MVVRPDPVDLGCSCRCRGMLDHHFFQVAWDHLPVPKKVALCAVALASMTAMGAMIGEAFSPRPAQRVIRGTRVVSERRLARMTRDPKGKQQIKFGTVPWPHALACSHVLIVGTTGQGKSCQIHQILGSLRQRGSRALVIDLNGDFAKRHWRRGDLRYDPLGRSNFKWNPLDEIKTENDIAWLINAAIPVGTTQNEENWRVYTRKFLWALVYRLRELDRLSMSELRYFVFEAGDKELGALLQDGKKPLRLQANNMVSSIKSMAQDCLGFLDLADIRSSKSISAWVRSGTGFLFITPRDKDLAALKTITNTISNLVISECMSAPSGQPYAPLAFVIDEVSSFDINDLQSLLEKGRKYSLTAVAGMQSTAQLRQKYGADGSATILSLFLTKIVFNPCDAETGEMMSRELGKQVVERRQLSNSYSSAGQTKTESWVQDERAAVESEDLRSLGPLVAYLKFTGPYPIAKIRVPLPT